MRVGMICPYSMGVWGGVQSQVIGLARTLRNQGVDVRVLAPCDGLPPEPWITPLGNSMPYAQNGSLAPVAPDAAAQLPRSRRSGTSGSTSSTCTNRSLRDPPSRHSW